MEYKKLTDEMLKAARDYVPLMEKMSFVRACAADCFDRMELRLSGTEYGQLAEGDTGRLSFQGTRYLGFERN